MEIWSAFVGIMGKRKWRMQRGVGFSLIIIASSVRTITRRGFVVARAGRHYHFHQYHQSEMLQIVESHQSNSTIIKKSMLSGTHRRAHLSQGNQTIEIRHPKASCLNHYPVPPAKQIRKVIDRKAFFEALPHPSYNRRLPPLSQSAKNGRNR